jgi:hypothetical protein
LSVVINAVVAGDVGAGLAVEVCATHVPLTHVNAWVEDGTDPHPAAAG